MDTNDNGKTSVFETHAQTVLGAVVLALLVGTGTLMWQMSKDVQALQKDVQYLTISVQNAGDDRFRGADWRREEANINRRFNDLEERIDRHEGIIRQNAAKLKRVPDPPAHN